ncbi:MAG: N-acetylglucosamine-6-phosphate deacetylase [Tissierellia bacterium]|nr:N-acetylglucosamine-6-phosphate deacetylase [Tissierellia bacterium]
MTPHEVLENFSLIIEDEKILDIIDAKKIDYKDYDEILDGENNYLAPGFIDIHNHGNSGYDIMDSSEIALDSIGKYHISNGVTSYLGTIITSSYENMLNSAKNISEYENKKDLAEILGIHLEGPFFNPIKKGAQPEKYIAKADLNFLKKLIEISNSKLKMVSIAPEIKDAIEVIKYLKKEDIPIAMAHSYANYEQTKMAIENGARIATHLFNGMREFDHREPGIIGASLTDDRVYTEIIYDRFHLHDASVKIAILCKGFDKIILVSDAMRAAGLKDGKYEIGGQIVFVKNNEPRLESGNIAGSTLNLRQAVYNVVKFLQIPIHQAVKMASLNPAKAINISKDYGSIEIGKKADFIIIDQDINIKSVYKNGRLILKND